MRGETLIKYLSCPVSCNRIVKNLDINLNKFYHFLFKSCNFLFDMYIYIFLLHNIFQF